MEFEQIIKVTRIVQFSHSAFFSLEQLYALYKDPLLKMYHQHQVLIKLIGHSKKLGCIDGVRKQSTF